jgi:hypothetical protein
MVTDYYAMLGADPGADAATLEAALARNQPIWSSGTRNPKNKHTYQSYLDQIPALRRTLLSDPMVRAAYDAELAAARRVERDGKLDQLQRLIRLRAAKGGLTNADRTFLRDEAVTLGLAPEDLDRLVALIPPQVDTPAETEEDEPDPPADILDPTTRRQIRVALDHLRRRDLFDALGVASDAPSAEIASRADAERRRWMQKAQVTAEKTAWLEVVSLAQSHLGTPAALARYERTLGAEREEALKGSIEFALKGLIRLDAGTRSALFDEAAALGISPDRVDRLIGRTCRAMGVARDLVTAASAGGRDGGGMGAPRLLRCRVCAGVTDYGQAARGGTKGADCRHCRAPLRWDCPLCRRQYWVDEPRCACGFRLADRGPLIHHFEAAQHAFKARDFETSLIHLKRVQDFAPTHVGARKGIEKVQQRLMDLDRVTAEFETALAGARLVAAGAALTAWQRLADPSTPALKTARASLAGELKRAEALAARARGLETTDPRVARALYRQARALAADWPEALAGLLRCPPDPPTALCAEFVNDRVRLHWTPPAPDDLGPVSYVVLRKPGGPLAHPADGTRIATLSEPALEDTEVELGQTVSYAVLSQRNGITSIGAVAVGPIPLLGEVKDIRVTVRSGAVDLAWSLPTAAVDVRVVRQLGTAPSGPRDGERIEALREEAHDHGLEDDRVYHYALYAIYRMPDGALMAAHGVSVTARPHPPVGALPAPRITQERDGRVRLAWDEPARGTVKILRTARPLAANPGDRLTLAAGAALEGHWLDPVVSGQALDPTPPPLGVCFYTPMTVCGGTFTVGCAGLFSCVLDPSELRATRVGNGSRVHLRWRWSPQAGQALVVARPGAPPVGPHDPHAHVFPVHEGQYGQQGRFTLTLPEGEDGPWHVRVYSVAVVGDEDVVSPGLEASAAVVVPGPHPEVTVSYTFRRSSFPGRSWSLTFRTEPPGAVIPPMALVAHPRTLPLSIDDGTVVAEFPMAHDGAIFPIDSGIDLAKQRARIFADTRTGAADLPPIRLRHPEAGSTRV